MIIPTKYIKENEALIGVGATLLQYLDDKNNISRLWENVKNIESVGTYERFVLALDFLYLLGLIDLHRNEIVRVKQ